MTTEQFLFAVVLPFALLFAATAAVAFRFWNEMDDWRHTANSRARKIGELENNEEGYKENIAKFAKDRDQLIAERNLLRANCEEYREDHNTLLGDYAAVEANRDMLLAQCEGFAKEVGECRAKLKAVFAYQTEVEQKWREKGFEVDSLKDVLRQIAKLAATPTSADAPTWLADFAKRHPLPATTLSRALLEQDSEVS